MNRRSLLFLILANYLFPSNASGKSGSANVLDFGAIGDGKNDDTVSLQHAIESGATQIIFPRGIYRLSSIDVDLTGVTIDAGSATLIISNAGNGFKVRKLKGSKLNFHKVILEEGARSFINVTGGVLATCDLNVDFFTNNSNEGSFLRLESTQKRRIIKEGIYFTSITGIQWINNGSGSAAPLFKITANFNACSVLSISGIDLRLLNSTTFCVLSCKNPRGATFSQIKVSDFSVEKLSNTFAHMEGCTMSGFENIGFYDMKSVSGPIFKLRSKKRNSGLYLRDIYRTKVNFIEEGCDVNSIGDILVENYFTEDEPLIIGE